MSRLYDTLRRMEAQRGKGESLKGASLEPVELVNSFIMEPGEIEQSAKVQSQLPGDTRLVALTDPRGLAAEKFRALGARLENIRKQHELKSVQITSAVSGEGKTLVAGNLAVTLAEHTGARVLAVEGDLHRPSLGALLGLGKLKGLGDWWVEREEKEKIVNYVYRVNDSRLWFLGAGATMEHPSQMLQSGRFAESLIRLASQFDWVVVDSAPILPLVDVNLWSRLVEGSLLVVREGLTPLAALKKSLESLDNPKLIGIVLNEASELDSVNYNDQYYGISRND